MPLRHLHIFLLLASIFLLGIASIFLMLAIIYLLIASIFPWPALACHVATVEEHLVIADGCFSLSAHGRSSERLWRLGVV